MKPPKPLTREQIRNIDRVAIEQYDMPGVVLMENAGRGTAQHVVELLGTVDGKRIVAVCGAGNNGGDGFVIARHLHNAGAKVTILLAAEADRLTGDAAVNFRIVKAMGLPTRPALTAAQIEQAGEYLVGADAIIDALLGTGFLGHLRSPMDTLIARINAAGDHGAKVVAVDIPSGLDCDTGLPGGNAVRADLTATFVAPKVGMLASVAADHVGRLVVVDIGVPIELVPRQD